MRLKILFNLFILGICVAACNKNDQPVSPQAESYVNFLSENSSTTKATDTQFETGDRISVFATTDGNIYRENYANNIAYTYLNERFIPTGEGIALEDERTSLYYCAIYPYLQIADYNWGNAFAFQVQSNQSTHSGYTNSDLMLAYTDQASSASLIPLKFNHQLSKVVINTVDFASSDLTIILSDVYTNVMVNLNDRSVTSSTNRKSTVTLGANGTNSYRAIIPSQTIKRDTQLATVTQNGNRYSVAAPKDITFSSGTQTTLTFVLNRWNEVDVYVGDYEPEEETGDACPYKPFEGPKIIQITRRKDEKINMVYNYQYDNQNRIMTFSYGENYDHIDHIWNYQYDQDKVTATLNDGTDQILEGYFNENGHIVEVVNRLTKESLVQYEYNTYGYLTNIKNEKDELDIRYDDNWNLTSIHSSLLVSYDNNTYTYGNEINISNLDLNKVWTSINFETFSEIAIFGQFDFLGYRSPNLIITQRNRNTHATDGGKTTYEFDYIMENERVTNVVYSLYNPLYTYTVIYAP